MSITVELPPDIEDRIRAIPDLSLRVAEFLRSQVGIEEWRARRYSPEAQAIVAGAVAEAARQGAEGVSRAQIFRELREAREEIGKHL